MEARLLEVEEWRYLFPVCGEIFRNVLAGEGRAVRGSSGRVPDHRGDVPDDEVHGEPHSSDPIGEDDRDGVPEVDLGAGRVDSELEFRAGLGQAVRKLFEPGQHMLAAGGDEFDLRLNRQVAEVQVSSSSQDVAEHCDIGVRTILDGGEPRDEFGL